MTREGIRQARILEGNPPTGGGKSNKQTRPKENRQTRNTEHTGERTTTADRNTDTGPPTQGVPFTPPKVNGTLCGEASQDTNRKRQQGNRGKRRNALNEMRRETTMRVRKNTRKHPRTRNSRKNNHQPSSQSVSTRAARPDNRRCSSPGVEGVRHYVAPKRCTNHVLDMQSPRKENWNYKFCELQKIRKATGAYNLRHKI